MTRDLTVGHPLKRILTFCIPLFIGNLFQQFYNIADGIIVGQFIGTQAFAAVGATGTIIFGILGFAQGSCAGFAIPVAQEFGAHDELELRRCVAAVAQVTVVISVPLTVITLLATRPLLTLLRTPPDVFEESCRYLTVIFAGIIPSMLYNLLASLLRSLGDSRTPLYFLAISSVLNVLMDLLFVGAFSLGVTGAAVATVTAQLLSGVMCLAYVAKKFPLLRLTREEWRVSMPHWRRELSSGLPMGLQISITAIGAIILQTAVNGLGSSVVASISASSKISSIFCAPMDAIGIAMATYCGQNIGAKRLDRVRQGVRQCALLLGAYSVVCLAIYYFLSPTIALMFIKPDEVEVLARIHQHLTVAALFYIPLILIYVYRNALQGMGFSNMAMFGGLLELIGRSCVAFLFVGRFGFDAVCFANPIAWILADCLLLPLYIYETQKLKRTLPASTLEERKTKAHA